MTDHYETRCPLCGGSDEQGCYGDCPNTMAEAREEAASRRGRSMSEWQPIKTAPKDGTVFLAYGPVDDHPNTVSWDHYRNGWRGVWDGNGVIEHMDGCGTDYVTGLRPTHWMPLPAPPKPDSEAA